MVAFHINNMLLFSGTGGEARYSSGRNIDDERLNGVCEYEKDVKNILWP